MLGVVPWTRRVGSIPRSFLSDLASLRHFSLELTTTDSHKLLREYAETGSESAFRELVMSYIDLVYSVAVRLM
jgi:hypothetical protein